MERARLADEFEELLAAYLKSSGERELFLASELGRALVDAGGRPEELVAAHVTAMRRILARLSPTAVADGALRSYQVLLEALMAYFLAYQPPAPAAATSSVTAPVAGRREFEQHRDAFGLQELYQRARDRAAQFRDLVEVGNALIGADLSDALEQALARAMGLTDAEAGAIWLLDEQGSLVLQASKAGTAAADLEHLARQVLDARRSVVREGGPPGAGRTRDVSALGLPLTPPDGRPVGALTILLAGGADPQAGDEIDLLQLLASQLGAVITNTRLYDAVSKHERSLQELVRQLITAQEEERRRVAYDIHDGLAQTTAATFQQLQLLDDNYHPSSPQARAHLDAALQAGQRAVTEARQLISGLRPTILDDFGLSAAVVREVEALRAEGRDASYEDHLGHDRLPPEIETTLYRVVQESLTNIRKHAGPSPVHVRLKRMADAVQLEVRDRGRGFRTADLEAPGSGQQVGLAGMRERVALLGGTFTLESAPGQGTAVVAVISLR